MRGARQMGRREMNVEVFQDTIDYINGSERLQTAIKKSREIQKLILEK